MQHTVTAAPIRQQTIAGVPRRGLRTTDQCCRRSPAENPMANAMPFEPAADPPRLGRGFGAQSVVDRDGEDVAAAPPAPDGSEQGKRHTVTAAGDRHGDPRLRLEWTDGLHQPLEL